MLKKIILLLVLACAGYGLYPRVMLESRNNNVAIIADFREIQALAKNSGLETQEALKILIHNGLTGLMVSELTGDNIAHGFGYAEINTFKDAEQNIEGSVISILPNSPNYDLLNHWLKIRFSNPNSISHNDLNSKDDNNSVIVPLSINMLKTLGVIPDTEGLEIAKTLNLPVYYRPAPSPGHLSENAALMLKNVHEKYNLAIFSPAGEVVSGYPDVSALANVSHEFKLPLAMVEFAKQLGAQGLNNLSFPNLIPLHSVTNDEMLARRISRDALRDRLIRAAVERSVRLLLLRTAPQNTANFLFSDFSREIKLLADGLTERGFKLAWPENIFGENNNLKFNIFTAWALSTIMLYAIYKYLSRMGMNTNFKTLSIFVIADLVLTLASWKIFIVGRLTGALCAPMIATEAALMAMDFNKNKNLFGAFLFAMVGGLALASFFSVPQFMLRLYTFTGVKLTLVLPPVLVLMHDLKNRIHPESIGEFISRPPVWGELILGAGLLIAVGIIIFRSGNVSFSPGFEMKMRTFLEKLLIARPRTREVFIGYPSLLLLNYLVYKNYFARGRELFRIGVALGFSSVINSFCHFHTPVYLILLREFNGLWTGLIVGLIVVALVKFVLIPLMKFLEPVIE